MKKSGAYFRNRDEGVAFVFHCGRNAIQAYPPGWAKELHG